MFLKFQSTLVPIQFQYISCSWTLFFKFQSILVSIGVTTFYCTIMGDLTCASYGRLFLKFLSILVFMWVNIKAFRLLCWMSKPVLLYLKMQYICLKFQSIINSSSRVVIISKHFSPHTGNNSIHFKTFKYHIKIF